MARIDADVGANTSARPLLQLRHEHRRTNDGRIGNTQYDSHESAGTPIRIGVCAALGLRPLQLAIMILGICGFDFHQSSHGIMLGLGINHYFATSGLDFRWVFGHRSSPGARF